MLTQYETVIWDWNGTLLNDIWLCVDIVNGLLRNHNDRQLDIEDYKDVFGFPITAYYERIGMNFEHESFDQLTEKFMSRYTSEVTTCELHTQTIDVLKMLKQRMSNQFILTAAHKESVLTLLNHYSIIDYFTEIEGLDNHRAESKIDIGMKWIEQDKISRKTTVLIGDTIHDGDVAAQMGIDCILISNGHQSKSRLLDNARSNKIRVLDNMSELLSFAH